jgi:hypothetical protein
VDPRIRPEAAGAGIAIRRGRLDLGDPRRGGGQQGLLVLRRSVSCSTVRTPMRSSRRWSSSLSWPCIASRSENCGSSALKSMAFSSTIERVMVVNASLMVLASVSPGPAGRTNTSSSISCTKARRSSEMSFTAKVSGSLATRAFNAIEACALSSCSVSEVMKTSNGTPDSCTSGGIALFMPGPPSALRPSAA